MMDDVRLLFSQVIVATVVSWVRQPSCSATKVACVLSFNSIAHHSFFTSLQSLTEATKQY
jgi:hypothetical protein